MGYWVDKPLVQNIYPLQWSVPRKLIVTPFGYNTYLIVRAMEEITTKLNQNFIFKRHK